VRLGSAPEVTRQVVAACAVLGTESDAGLLQLTSGRAEAEVVDAVEDAVERALLVELHGSGSYDVPYDRMRTIITSRLSEARRRLLHGRAADALIPRNARDPRSATAAIIARHLAAAGRDEEAAAWHRRAAEEARGLWAHAEALDHLTVAVGLGYDPADGHRGRGEALTALGRYDEAIEAYERAAARTEDGTDLAVLEHLLADVHHRLGSWTTAHAHLENALALLDDQPDAATLRARTRADLALVQLREGDLEAAAQSAVLATAEADTSRDAAALAQAHNVRGVLAAAADDVGPAREHLLTSLRIAADLDDPSVAVAAWNNLALLESRAGDDAAALDAAEHALQLGEVHGDRHRLAALHTNMADLLHAAGRERESLDHLTRAAAIFATVDRDAERRPEIWKLVAW